MYWAGRGVVRPGGWRVGAAGAGRGACARTGPWRVLKCGGRCWECKGGGWEVAAAGMVQREMLVAWTRDQGGGGETRVCL